MEPQFDSSTTNLLRDLFEKSEHMPEGVTAKQFRIDHRDNLKLLDKLENTSLIEHDYTTHIYRINIAGLLLVNNDKSRSLFDDINKIFDLLRATYINDHDKTVSITDIATQLNISRQRAIECLNITKNTMARCGGSTNLEANDAYIAPSEGLIRFEQIEELASASIKLNFPDAFGKMTNHDKPHGNTLINAQKREDVLGAALTALANFPDQCRAGTGKAQGAKIATLLDEKSQILFEKYQGKPPLSYDKISRLINKWINLLD